MYRDLLVLDTYVSPLLSLCNNLSLFFTGYFEIILDKQEPAPIAQELFPELLERVLSPGALHTHILCCGFRADKAAQGQHRQHGSQEIEVDTLYSLILDSFQLLAVIPIMCFS